jgi:hypothetical protein
LGILALILAVLLAVSVLLSQGVAAQDEFPVIELPDGYQIEKVVGGLTFPTSVTRIGLQAIQDARVLPDGRVGARVTLVDPNTPTPEEADLRFVVFVMVGDRWLIDEVIDFPASGTPIP